MEIVPPPEEPEKKAEEKPKAAEEPQPEEAKKEEPPPPPEPPKQEEAKKEEPPPPPPQEEAKQEPPPASEQARGQPVPPLRPVFEFGEKDTGPRKAQDGNSSQEAAMPPEEEMKPEVETAEAVKPPEEEPAVAETPPGNPAHGIQLPEVDVAATTPQQNGVLPETQPDVTKMEMVSPPPAAPKTEPIKTPAEKPLDMLEAKKLFSGSQTGDQRATTAMGSKSRGVRAGELCATELGQQLRHASPSFPSPWVPTYLLPTGTVLTVRQGAFKAGTQWYNLRFRCEIDEDATRVVSFAFDVGDPVPPGDWRKRGFPEF